jgi:hypothetical protein
MKIILASFVFASVMAGTAQGQTSAISQTSAETSGNTSFSANKSGAQVSSSSSADAAANANIHRSGSHPAAASRLQSASDARTEDGDKLFTSSSNAVGAASSVRSGRGLTGSTDPTFSQPRSAGAAGMRSSASGGAHLKKVGSSIGLSHENNATLVTRGESSDSSTVGSGMLGTRGNGHLNGITRTGIRTK